MLRRSRSRSRSRSKSKSKSKRSRSRSRSRRRRNSVVDRASELLSRPTEIHQAYRTGMASDIKTIKEKEGRLRDSTLTKSIFVKDAERRLGVYFKKSVNLEEWSRKHFTYNPTLVGIKIAANELIGKNIVYDGKIVIMSINWNSGYEIYVRLPGYNFTVGCFYATFDLYKQTAYLDSLTPYKKTCPSIIPASCFDIYELVGKGLGTRRLTLFDAARTNLCSQKRLTRYDQNAKYEVMLSALTAINTDKTYYERYGFKPFGKTMDNFYIEMNKKYDNSENIVFPNHYFDTNRDFLKACVNMMIDFRRRNECRKLSDEVKKYICSKINLLTLPNYFERFTGINTYS